MNKRTVIANLNKIANELDNSGMFKEATEITNVMKRVAQPWISKPTPQAPTKPGMNANQVVYKVLKSNFGPDYNNMKDLKIKIRDNYSTLVNQVEALAQESGLKSPQSAALRLKQVMDASSWHSEAKRPPMYGQGGGTSVFDPTQRAQPSAAEANYIQGNSLVSKAMDWVTKNGGEGAEPTIQKAIAQSQAGKMSPVMLNQIKALLQPRVDKERNRQKALQGTAAGAMGSFNREPKPFAIGD